MGKKLIYLFVVIGFLLIGVTVLAQPKIDLSGKWQMSGNQTNVPRSYWEARLILNSNRTLQWEETKGANVGARRSGRWEFDGKTFKMTYTAPKVGPVTWEARSVTRTSMSGTYRTPQAGPQPVGWGGTWAATKLSK